MHNIHTYYTMYVIQYKHHKKSVIQFQMYKNMAHQPKEITM